MSLVTVQIFTILQYCVKKSKKVKNNKKIIIIIIKDSFVSIYGDIDSSRTAGTNLCFRREFLPQPGLDFTTNATQVNIPKELRKKKLLDLKCHISLP